MKTTLKHHVIASSLFAATACGTATPAQQPSQDAESLVGRWQSACTAMNQQQAFKLDFDIQAKTWAVDYAVFGDTTCAARFLTVRIEGPYEVGNVSAQVPEAREARFGFTRKTVTPHSAAAAAFLASAQGCGVGGFAEGTARDIGADGCPGLGQQPIAQCSADHDLVKREPSALRFGARPADNDMCSPAKRPTALAPLASNKVD